MAGMVAGIELRNLSVGYGRRSILFGVSGSVEAGEVCALVGGNGSGKSTLLRTITGGQRTLGGEIDICGRRLESFSRRELAAAMAIVTTEHGLTGGLKVEEVVYMGRHVHLGLLGRSSGDDREIVNEAMEMVGIGDMRAKRMAYLSDGERQKVMIARALAQGSPVIVLDEPFSYLDPASRIEIMDILTQLAAKEGRAVLMSTHDVAQALRMTGKIWLIGADGEFYQSDPAEMVNSGLIDNVFKNKRVKFDRNQNDFVIL